MTNTIRLLSGVAQGYEPHVIQKLWQQDKPKPTIYITPNEEQAEQLVQQLRFCLEDSKILFLPEWDCLPYDRVSPSQDVLGERHNTLLTILEQERTQEQEGYIIVGSCNSILQRLAPKTSLEADFLQLFPGERYALSDVISYLSGKGYNRTETVREAGEFAIRGDILDIFPIGEENPLRLDFFGDILENIRAFDPITQTTLPKEAHLTKQISLKPSSEICLTPETISTFRKNYRDLFGTTSTPLYETISQGRRYSGMEHWFPLFFEKTETLIDYLSDALILLDVQTDDAVRTRLELIHDYYRNRTIQLAGDNSPPFNPVPPAKMFMTLQEWGELRQSKNTYHVTPFSGDAKFLNLPSFQLESTNSFEVKIQDFETHPSPVLEQHKKEINYLESFKKYLTSHKKPVLIAALTDGSRERLQTLLQEHQISPLKIIEDLWPNLEDPDFKTQIGLMTYPLEKGFEAPDFVLFTEQDLLGQKVIRQSSKKRQISKILLEMNQLAMGDLIVHRDHGIGQYQGLVALKIGDHLHDCLCIKYDGGDKLFLPVENIEAITKYGSENGSVSLDRLGSTGWQTRKARVRKRIREVADYLIKIAAERSLHRGTILHTETTAYDDFCARFPYLETEDQQRAIQETLSDLSSGTPMDRLVCGDVGFGKTEVALRAAFATVSNGKQVAIVTPTTLLCRQHYKTFLDRFSHTGFRVEQLSRFVTASQAQKIRQDLKTGKVNIIIATHALFSEQIGFSDLGLVIIDEEQHFGVKQKEKLKQLQTDVHVLTLTATPIPRTLQLALTGVREMSVIATPPIDRLAVRTFVTPYDPLVIREAILREHYRGGQVFFVCPRLEGIEEMEPTLRTLVPEIKLVSAHGQMPSEQLESVMTDFYDRKYDLLLSTNIVESGIDIASANTLIIHRADLFGLAQLYQLRGRVGRSKVQGYAYLTLPTETPVSDTAKRRLDVIQTLDKLGAGFSLASHDMDIRGTGNIVGEEQSGHIKEVGAELYQHLLHEAILMARAEQEIGPAPLDTQWTPQINLGTSVMIPERYISDLNLRLNMYRRAASLQSREEIDAFAAEMIDRFGKLPNEVHNLFEIIEIKNYCRQAGIEKVDVGPKGIVISFHNNTFANPSGLMEYIKSPKTAAKVRPDQKIVFMREWGHVSQRSRSTKLICRNLAHLAILGKKDVGKETR